MARFDLRKIYALAFGSIVALGLAEGLSRVFSVGAPQRTITVESRTWRTGGPWPYRPGSTLKYTYPDNPRGYFDSTNSVTGTINSLGLRGRETTIARPPAVRRVAFFGDSFTLGVGVRDEHTLPALVESELRERAPAIEVLNFGASGSAPTDQVRILRDYGTRFQPAVAVDVVFLNDAGSTPTMDFISRPWYFPALRRRSWFLNAVIGRIERDAVTRRMVAEYDRDFEDSSAGFAVLKAALTDGARVARENGAVFVVAVYPVLFHVGGEYPFAAIHRRLSDFCRSQGIPFVDLQPAFTGRGDRELWVHATDQHPNEVANALAASRLADELRAIGLVERQVETSR